MSGVTNILIAPPVASGPTVHPPYCLDVTLGTAPPPLLTAGFTGANLTTSFNYTAPDDGNAFRWLLIVMVSDVPSNRVYPMNYGGQGQYLPLFAISFQQMGDSGPLFKSWYLFLPVTYNGGPVNDTFIITRSTASPATINFNIQVYTFGDVQNTGTSRIGSTLALDSVSSDSFSMPSLQARSAIVQFAARTDYTPATGQDTSITSPVGAYTYSPTGDQGDGLLTNGNEAMVIEMAFDIHPATVANTTWQLLNGQAGEGGIVNAEELTGATY